MFPEFFFFFQAEDGIRDDLVTGVQTCALPILSAWDLARGVEFFLVVDGQREEIDARFGLGLTDRRGQNHRFAIGRHDGSIGLARDSSCFKNELAPAPIDLLAMYFEHSNFPSFPPPACLGPSLLMWSRKLIRPDARYRAPVSLLPELSSGPLVRLDPGRFSKEESAASTQTPAQHLI